MEEQKLYAKLNEDAYDHPVSYTDKEILNYYRVDIRPHEYVVYVNENERKLVIVCIGTHRRKDLFNDFLAFNRLEKLSNRYKRIKQLLYDLTIQKPVIENTETGKKFIIEKIVMTAHSIGAFYAVNIGKMFNIETHAFNPYIEKFKKLNSNQTLYLSSLDPINLNGFTSSGGKKIIKTFSGNPHKLQNWL